MSYTDQNAGDGKKVACGVAAIALIGILAYFLLFSGSSMSQEQYDQISNGMTHDDVVQIVGSDGKHSASMGGMMQMDVYEWRGPGMETDASVTFVDGRVISKAMVSL